jgi:hypothetical protein
MQQGLVEAYLRSRALLEGLSHYASPTTIPTMQIDTCSWARVRHLCLFGHTAGLTYEAEQLQDLRCSDVTTTSTRWWTTERLERRERPRTPALLIYIALRD